MAKVALVVGPGGTLTDSLGYALRQSGLAVTLLQDEAGGTANAAAAEDGIRSFGLDPRDRAACMAAVERVEAERGPVRVLVNAPPPADAVDFQKMSKVAWDRAMQGHLGACQNMAKAVWAGMSERRYGRIVTIVPMEGQLGRIGRVHVGAAAAALHGMTKVLALEGGPIGITANAIRTGFVDTGDTLPLDVRDAAVAATPVGRLGRVEEIARAVLFLCAEEAGFVNGSTLSINGGFPMH